MSLMRLTTLYDSEPLVGSRTKLFYLPMGSKDQLGQLKLRDRTNMYLAGRLPAPQACMQLRSIRQTVQILRSLLRTARDSGVEFKALIHTKEKENHASSEQQQRKRKARSAQAAGSEIGPEFSLFPAD